MEKDQTQDAPSSAASRVLARDELLEHILQHVDPLELGSTAVLVCRRWRQLVQHSQAIWEQHLDRPLLDLHRGLHPASPTTTSTTTSSAAPTSASAHTQILPEAVSLVQLYMACHARNLLKNPTFSQSANVAAHPLLKSRRPWVVKDSGSPVVFQNPPQGVRRESEQCYPPHPLPYASGVRLADQPLASALHALQRLVTPEQPGCLATTQDWAEVIQVVELQDELVARGLTPLQACAVLDSGVALGLSLMVAAHHSHGGTFAVGIMLDNGQGPVPSMERFVQRASSHHFYSQKRFLPAGSGWQRFAHVVHACPPGCRRAVVLLRGRMFGGSGNAWLPGVFLEAHHAERSNVPQGPKFASAELVLLPAQRVPAFGENASSSKWERSAYEAQQHPNDDVPWCLCPPGSRCRSHRLYSPTNDMPSLA